MIKPTSFYLLFLISIFPAVFTFVLSPFTTELWGSSIHTYGIDFCSSFFLPSRSDVLRAWRGWDCSCNHIISDVFLCLFFLISLCLLIFITFLMGPPPLFFVFNSSSFAMPLCFFLVGPFPSGSVLTKRTCLQRAWLQQPWAVLSFQYLYPDVQVISKSSLGFRFAQFLWHCSCYFLVPSFSRYLL